MFMGIEMEHWTKIGYKIITSKIPDKLLKGHNNVSSKDSVQFQ